MECDVTARIASLIHQVHGHMVEARTNEQVYVDDGSPVDWENLRPCRACGLHIGKDENDPCIANLPGSAVGSSAHGNSQRSMTRSACINNNTVSAGVNNAKTHANAWME